MTDEQTMRAANETAASSGRVSAVAAAAVLLCGRAELSAEALTGAIAAFSAIVGVQTAGSAAPRGLRPTMGRHMRRRSPPDISGERPATTILQHRLAGPRGLQLDDRAAMAVAMASGKPVGRDVLWAIEAAGDEPVLLTLGFAASPTRYQVSVDGAQPRGILALELLAGLAAAD